MRDILVKLSNGVDNIVNHRIGNGKSFCSVGYCARLYLRKQYSLLFFLIVIEGAIQLPHFLSGKFQTAKIEFICPA